MKLTELLLSELDRESERSRRVLEKVPDGKYDWTPHDKSMKFGNLAEMVATMPRWVAMEIQQDELDLAPPEGPRNKPQPLRTGAELIKALDSSVQEARAALKTVSEDHLGAPWRLLVGGKVVLEMPRHEMIRDTLNHLAHHRGQMTVYLRLLGSAVPAVYGPSADDQRFT